MRHYGDQVIMKGDQTSSLLVKELMRDMDLEEEESSHMMNKFKDRDKLVDKIVRMNIRKAQIT